MRKEIEFSASFTQVKKIKAIEISKDVFAFDQISYCIKSNQSGESPIFNETSRQGIAKLWEIEKVQKDLRNDVVSLRIKIDGVKQPLPVGIMTSEMIESFKKLDFWTGVKSSQTINQRPYDFVEKLKESEVTELSLVAFDSGSHMLFGVDGIPLPVGIWCDYMTLRFNSETYNLENLHAHLKTRKDIAELSGVDLIPYYNNESGNEKAISFRIIPDKQLYAEAWNIALELETDYPSTRVAEIYIRNLDGIGANQFLKQRVS